MNNEAFEKIRKALMKSINDADLNVPILIENQSVEAPPVGVDWLRLVLFFNPVKAATLGVNGTDEYTGVLTISINGALDKGPSAISDLVSKVHNIFRIGLSYSYDDIIVTVNSIDIGPIYKERHYASSLFSVFWFSRILRN